MDYDRTFSRTERTFSSTLSRTLDHLGYSRAMVKHRGEMYREEAEILSKLSPNTYDTIIAGSKGEGLTAPFESDTDIIITCFMFFCGDDTNQLGRDYPNWLTFQTERHSTPPGYTYLKHTGPLSAFIYPNSLLSENGAVYLSNDFCEKHARDAFQIATHLFESEQRVVNISLGARSGPSVILKCIGFGDVDRVTSFICVCPNLLNSWTTRSRYNNWPTLETIQKITHLQAHVVPVGFKGSVNKKYEWRICFTKAELCLMHSMNDTQTKLYILLKAVAKKIIQPFADNMFKDISSYVMKNIVLWMAELFPQELFTEELLIDRLIHSLQFLNLCLINNFLPNYMIPSRNLLAGQLDIQKRGQLSNLLNGLIRDRNVQHILQQKWPKLNVGLHTMLTIPGTMLRYGKWRNTVEKLLLLYKSIFQNMSNDILTWPFFNNIVGNQSANVQDIILQQLREHFNLILDIDRPLHSLLLPDRVELTLLGMDTESIFQERLRTALS